VSIDELGFSQVDYKQTALKVVVCQLRFHPILEIGGQLPAGFHRRIRKEYPELVQLEHQALGPGQALPLTIYSWQFKSKEADWVVGLGTGAVSVETKKYVNYPDFDKRLSTTLKDLREEYGVETLTRVGLRYINEIDCESGKVQEILSPSLLGPVADARLGKRIIDARQQFTVDLGDNKRVTVRHGRDSPHRYVLDIDAYQEAETVVGDALSLLREFNEAAYQVFRWAISNELHQSMGPRSRE
jgi:uncharacterized protein (TIGR04255 family)